MLPQRLQRSHMPSDRRISIRGSGGIDRILTEPHNDRRQPLSGFEGTFVDVVDYIVRITHRISEDGDLDYIRDTYAVDADIVTGAMQHLTRAEMIDPETRGATPTISPATVHCVTDSITCSVGVRGDARVGQQFSGSTPPNALASHRRLWPSEHASVMAQFERSNDPRRSWAPDAHSLDCRSYVVIAD